MQDECVLAKILVQADGSELDVGAPIALVVEDLDEYADFMKLDPAEQLAGVQTQASTPAASKETSSQPAAPVPDTPTVESAPKSVNPSLPVRFSPAARHLVETLQLDPQSIPVDVSQRFTIGKHNKLIRKEDVIKHVNSGTAEPRAAVNAAVESPGPADITSAVSEGSDSDFFDIPNNTMRKVIAKRLLESKLTVPHAYTSKVCNIDELMKFRKALKKDFDVNVSVNDLIIKAASLSLRDVPAVNSRYDPASGTIKPPIQSSGGGPQIDISVAVATPTGLITPIVFGADKRGLVDINSAVRELLDKSYVTYV